MAVEDQVAVAPVQGAYFRKKLLRWHLDNARHFPWRETDDAYQILLAEVLLQRTQAPQVAERYKGILVAFPTVHALASAPLETIQDVLRPLGLAKRAITLKKMGEELVNRYDSRVPASVSKLMGLPGVGRYIATAAAVFAASAPYAVVDANVIRVLERFFGITSRKRRARDDAALWRTAELLVPRRRSAKYNRALIDFAAVVCRPRNPLCPECPLHERCTAVPTLVGRTS